MGAPQCRILRRHDVGPRGLAEEGLYPAGRREGDQDPPTSVADEGPDVRHTARPQKGISRPQDVPLVPHLDDELALESVEPLVLLEVQMPGRTAPGVERVLEHEQSAVRRDHLEVDRADAEPPGLTGTVRARRHEECGRRAGRLANRPVGLGVVPQ